MFAKVIKDRATFEKISGTGKVLLVDVRSPVQYRDGNISGSVNMPLRKFLNEIRTFDTKTKVIMYGSSISDDDLRSGANYAAQLGFDRVFISDYSSIRER
jgi:rhodanese-related sulfurtransferase